MGKITVTRDSVCAADDVDAPHVKTVSIGDDWSIEEILSRIIPSYLPLISGGKATWSVAADNPIAVMAQEWGKPRLLCLPEYPFHDTPGFVKITSLHFNYHAQDDPDTVFRVLRRYRHKVY
ncbi:MAG TPA: hypothetical protein PKY31_01040 [Spirochaetota bacterium]|nr:hypothetical protein [Spirochaetota bacterium]